MGIEDWKKVLDLIEEENYELFYNLYGEKLVLKKLRENLPKSK